MSTDMVLIPRTDLEALLAITAWAARTHTDTLPEALLVPAGDVLARYQVQIEVERPASRGGRGGGEVGEHPPPGELPVQDAPARASAAR